MKEKIFYVPISEKKPAKTSTKIHKKHINRDKIKNISLGLSLIGIGILSAVISGDGTAMMMTIAIGLAAILS